MSKYEEAVNDFLAQKRIAVAGVSRGGGESANAIYRKLRGQGYEVFAINPNAEMLEGDPSYPDLKSVPGELDGVVISTHPEVTPQVVRECNDLGIKRVWMHRSFGDGSVSQEAVDYASQHGITAIAGGCPMMYCEPDIAHRCMRWVIGVTGGLPDPA